MLIPLRTSQIDGIETARPRRETCDRGQRAIEPTDSTPMSGGVTAVTDTMPARSASPRRTPMKRVALASFVGSTIEFYDFYVYGTATALVFPKVSFPQLGSAMATIASLATFAAAFLSRPFGAVAFGHFGDRVGRKRTLVATLLIMGLSTVAVGLVPGSAAIGFAAPLILLVLRLLQGFALGGEWAGSALLTAEYAPTAQRGMWGMFTSLGGGAGLVLTSLMFLGVNNTIGEKSSAFMSWGWRIPFLASALLVVIALYVRASVKETPVFAAEKARSAPSKAPVVDLFRFQRRHVVLASGFVRHLCLQIHGWHISDELCHKPPRLFPRPRHVRRRAGWLGADGAHRGLGAPVR